MKPRIRMQQIFNHHCITDTRQSRRRKKQIRRQVKRSERNRVRQFLKKYFL